MTDKYNNLLAALKQYVAHAKASDLDSFLCGYAGDDWQAAQATRANIIYIERDGLPVAQFDAGHNRVVAAQLWVFLVRQLQTGYSLTLSTGAGAWQADSGQQVEPAEYAALMDKMQGIG